MEKEGSEKRSGDPMESEVPSKRSHFQTPNWGDNPSSLGFNLMNLALETFNRDWAQRVKEKPDTYAFAQYTFVGGLHISSFVEGGVWCHLNFQTKMVGVVDVVDLDENQPYLFFAELFRSHYKSEYEVKSVNNFGPVKYVYKAKLGGCKACDRSRHRDIMMHPIDGFIVGCTPQYEVTDVISTSQDAYSALMREKETISELHKDFHNDDPTVNAYSAMMREKARIYELGEAFNNTYPVVVYGELADKFGQLALEYYNEAARNNQESEYNFVKSKCCSTFKFREPLYPWFHMNFVACNKSKGEEFLFFAEVIGGRVAEVVNCQILGPLSHVAPKLGGCIGCDITPCRSEIVHPISGVIDKARFLVRWRHMHERKGKRSSYLSFNSGEFGELS